jgi:GH25 family lysozyme M1 (1,4-beta-N-acetylmuramidase)
MNTLLVVFCLFIAAAFATHGVDVSAPTATSSFSCMVNNGYHFAVVRAYRSNGTPDPNGAQTINNARAGGMSNVDAYMFPCPTCGNPAKQMSDTVASLKAGQAKYGMIWLDIEGPQYWHKSQQANRDFFNGLVAQGRAMGVHMGVYTSKSQWIPIMGDWSGGSSLPLWYAHYDGNPSFSDFSAFGGWSKPSIKQFKGTTSLCGGSVDENWY